MKKLLSIILALALFAAAFGTISVSAEKNADAVHVVVKNGTFSTTNGAPWQGVLLDTTVPLNAEDSLESVIERAITENSYEFTVSQYGYISSINGLAEYAVNGSGGWMATLNNWFTADGTTAYTVANGGLQAGDEIVMMYTCAWGADVGSLYGDFTTTLSADEFGFRGSFVSEATTSTILKSTIPKIQLHFSRCRQTKTIRQEFIKMSISPKPTERITAAERTYLLKTEMLYISA